MSNRAYMVAAKYEDQCPICGESIRAGDPIIAEGRDSVSETVSQY